MQEKAQAGWSAAATTAVVLPWKTQSVPQDKCRYSPPFPALPSTLVRLDMLLHRPVMDLEKVEAVVQTDPGFAAEVLRLATRKDDTRHSLRSCLIHLGIGTLRRATRIVPSWTQSLTQSEAWKLRWRLKRSRLIALAAETISASLADACPDKAFVAGLLHDLPGLVCLSDDCPCAAPECLPRVKAWNLPDYVVQAVRWHREPSRAAAEHISLVQRVAAARTWVNEIQLSSDTASLDCSLNLAAETGWQHMPNRDDVLSSLADKLDSWRLMFLD
jgi:HD-like signal output (HDOD) protein